MKILIKLFFLYFTSICICFADCGNHLNPFPQKYEDRYKKPHLIQESINEYRLVARYVYIKFNDYYIKFTKDSEEFNNLQLTLLVDVFKPKNKSVSSSKKLFYPKPNVNSLNDYFDLSERMKSLIKRSYVLGENDSLTKISYDTYEFKESSTWIRVCKHFHILITKNKPYHYSDNETLVNIFNFVSKKPLRFHTSSVLNKVNSRAVWEGHALVLVKRGNKQQLVDQYYRK